MNDRQPTARAVAAAAFRYEKARDALEKMKAVRFYHGTRVWVDYARYSGPGLAVTDHQCPPNMVAVQLENGNTWRCPIVKVSPA